MGIRKSFRRTKSIASALKGMVRTGGGSKPRKSTKRANRSTGTPGCVKC